MKQFGAVYEDPFLCDCGRQHGTKLGFIPIELLFSNMCMHQIEDEIARHPTKYQAPKWFLGSDDLVDGVFPDPIVEPDADTSHDHRSQTQLVREGVEPNPGPPKRGASRKRVVVARRSRTRSRSKPRARSRSVGGTLLDVVPMVAGGVADAYYPGSGALVSRIARAGAGFASKAFDTIKSGIKTIVGSGDYVIGPQPKYNVLSNSNQVPQFSSESRGSTFVAHREFIQNVTSPTVAGSFQVDQLAFQPGVRGMFKWLSISAAGYQMYKVHGAVVEFVSYTSTFAAGGTLGAVVLAPQYNVVQPPPASKQQMEQLEGCVSAVTTKNQVMMFECAPDTQRFNRWDIRVGDVPAGQDPRLFDFANLIIGVDGVPYADIKIGELWISYVVELCWPILQGDSIPAPTISSSRVYADSPTNLTGWDNSNMFAYAGNMWTTSGNNAYGVTLTNGNRFDATIPGASPSTPVYLRVTLQMRMTGTPAPTALISENATIGLTHAGLFGVGGAPLAVHSQLGFDNVHATYIFVGYYYATAVPVALSFNGPSTTGVSVQDAVLLVEAVDPLLFTP